ncbi:hypothetical protein DBB29_24615 [Pandoraea cepalis]|uniref:Uncharacterized protein n=1 Tax=Pandoraea cepalis TaxID=2508294 RepID=A0AAW7MGR7_9BURK|nr:hypothetical protein [Pandoraea cepalis]MDN4571845.1 hypothetical protein [Pandoraea cepalis]MDN4581299.1 hypothetical protein [Pandoraea cepalis]
MFKKVSIAVLLLAGVGAHAAPTFCPVAGNYRGQYSGNTDSGTLAAIVEPADGTVRGVAMSADGRQFPFGGVIARDGSFSSGAVATGAQFVGRFASTASGQIFGQGDWALGGLEGGKWKIIRESAPGNCL